MEDVCWLTPSWIPSTLRSKTISLELAVGLYFDKLMGTWIWPQVFLELTRSVCCSHDICFQRSRSVSQSLSIDSHVSQSFIDAFMKTNLRKRNPIDKYRTDWGHRGNVQGRVVIWQQHDLCWMNCWGSPVDTAYIFISCKMTSVLNSVIYEGVLRASWH